MISLTRHRQELYVYCTNLTLLPSMLYFNSQAKGQIPGLGVVQILLFLVQKSWKTEASVDF
jgi:hypothetical protein